MARRVEKIVFLGKGGIGKSTILSNLSTIYAQMGRKVLFVGCDPKRDGTMLLTNRVEIPTVVDQLVLRNEVSAESVLLKGRSGIDCIEAGGPEPGVGCAGRGIARMLEFFKESDLFARNRYDTVLFDLLGDIVCGGFATPLRRGFGQKVFIVVSDELMSLYAANNIARAVVNCAQNGVVLGGLVANLKDSSADEAMIGRFARLLKTRVVATLRRDPEFRKAEFRRLTIAEHAPGSATVRTLRRMARTILVIDPGRVPRPTPMDDRSFYELSRTGFRR
ncbi:MAG: AAA family ATPase [Deltaproteobacteria bacterium]|nr:AAA family ATPase [Deltaproteobacteria bacterium]